MRVKEPDGYWSLSGLYFCLVFDATDPGKRGSGRKRIGMLDELIEESCVQLKRKSQNRQFWRIWKPWTCQKGEN